MQRAEPMFSWSNSRSHFKRDVVSNLSVFNELSAFICILFDVHHFKQNFCCIRYIVNSKLPLTVLIIGATLG